jgi:hypothetical protein
VIALTEPPSPPNEPGQSSNSHISDSHIGDRTATPAQPIRQSTNVLWQRPAHDDWTGWEQHTGWEQSPSVFWQQPVHGETADTEWEEWEQQTGWEQQTEWASTTNNYDLYWNNAEALWEPLSNFVEPSVTLTPNNNSVRLTSKHPGAKAPSAIAKTAGNTLSSVEPPPPPWLPPQPRPPPQPIVVRAQHETYDDIILTDGPNRVPTDPNASRILPSGQQLFHTI